MTHGILHAFLRRQCDEGLALAAASDLVSIEPLAPPDGGPPDRFVVHLTCRGLVRTPRGAIEESGEFVVGIWFPDDYLRVANPFEVLTWLHPRHAWHPNISAFAPAICIGHLAPGTGLVDLVYQVWEIVTWQKVTMREDDALNRDACQWARANLARMPVDARPLKRRTPAFHADDISPGASHASH
jgi:hypothetical protein